MKDNRRNNRNRNNDRAFGVFDLRLTTVHPQMVNTSQAQIRWSLSPSRPSAMMVLLCFCGLLQLSCNASFVTTHLGSKFRFESGTIDARKSRNGDDKFTTLFETAPSGDSNVQSKSSSKKYDIGAGKNRPIDSSKHSPTDDKPVAREKTSSKPKYSLGLGKNAPVPSEEIHVAKAGTVNATTDHSTASVSTDREEAPGLDASQAASVVEAARNWNVPEPIIRKTSYDTNRKAAPKAASSSSSPEPPKAMKKTKEYQLGVGQNPPLVEKKKKKKPKVTHSRKQNTDPAFLSRALWSYKGHNQANVDEEPAVESEPPAPSVMEPVVAGSIPQSQHVSDNMSTQVNGFHPLSPPESARLTHDQIDFSIPPSVYDPDKNIDLVWDLMRIEARREAEREPLLVSFLYSTILNHPSLESALAFHLANRLSSPTMMSTQIMSLITEALDRCPVFRRYVRSDMLAVRDRDPACTCLPDVFLYFKGFHALETHRVAHYLWKERREVLAHYLQSQVSQAFQIDIHPNATLGSGIMLDHGTGIVIGETAVVGHNCSVLHHVTLGGSGKKGLDRHPKIGDGVLLGAGASVLGNIKVGNGCQIGAGTLVIGDLPDHSVAVGVPAKVIGSFADDAQPSIEMNQVGSKESEKMIITFESEGI